MLVAGGCDEAAPSFEVTVEIITPAGTNPLEGTDIDMLRIQLREGDGEPSVHEVPIDGGRFDVPLRFSDIAAEVRTTVEFTGPATRLHGAPPPFRAGETATDVGQGAISIVVGPPTRCEVLAGAELVVPRSAAGAAPLASFALLAGGVEAGGPSSRAEFLDLLRLDVSRDADDQLPGPLGAARTVPFTDREILILSELGAPLAFDLGTASTRSRAVTLFDGAGPGTSSVSIDGGGAVVAGGAGGVARFAWLTASGVARSGDLAAPRDRPALAALGGAVLVVAGGAGPLAEVVEQDVATGRVVVADPATERVGGALFGETTLLLAGGVDGAGDPVAETVLLQGCPACTAGPGPAWPEPRTSAAVVVTPDGGWIIGGEVAGAPVATVDRVVVDGAGGARFVAAGPLVFPRADPAAFAIEAGLVFVAGGRDAGGPRRDVEVCFPAELAPLE